MELGPVAGASPAEQHRFPCPTCGADLRFEPASGMLKCQHCGHEEAVPAPGGPIPELDLRAVEHDSLPADIVEEHRFAQCPSCGAQIELGLDDHARECPFCASPIVTDTGPHRQIKPQAGQGKRWSSRRTAPSVGPSCIGWSFRRPGAAVAR